MNYVFKMIAVVMSLGVLVLQGCQTSNSQISYNSYSTKPLSSLDNFTICNNIRAFVGTKMQRKYIEEGIRRRVDCAIKANMDVANETAAN